MRRATLVTLVSIAVLAVFVQGNVGTTATGRQMNAAIRAALATKVQKLPSGRPVPSVSGGVLSSYQEATFRGTGAHISTAYVPPIHSNSKGCSHVFAGTYPNIRANQDCDLRRQAEEQIGVNPTDSNNIVVGQNDSRIGFNQTGLDFSTNGGTTFGDYLPGTRFLDCQGIGQDAFSDPAFTFDGDGNLYYSAVGFDLNTPITGIYVWKSNENHKGSFLHNPNPAISPSNEYSSNPRTVHTNCSAPNLSDDKQLMAADTFVASPYFNNVYITWTIFDFHCGNSGQDYCASPIYFSESSDGGNTWSGAQEISGNNPAVCQFGNFFDPARSASDCDFDQGASPVVGPDGTIYVSYDNCNTPSLVCQQLFVKSINGGTTWSTPVRVGLDYDTQPFNFGNATMNAEGCPFGRQCLPPNGYRMNDFPSLSIDTTNGMLAVFWSDFRNGGPCATDPGTGLPTYPCTNYNNDVFVSFSLNGGASWSNTRLVSRTGNASNSPDDPNAQWQSWGAVGSNGNFYVGYYDRKYGGCDSTGCNDITLAVSSNKGSSWSSYSRITTASMPNLTPSNNAVQAGFLGDYMWVSRLFGATRLAWADTRGLAGTVEEDVYTACVGSC